MDGNAMLALLVDHPQPWTPEDLESFPDKFRAEVIDGTLIVESNPFRNHIWTTEDLARLPESTLFEIIDGILYVNAAPNYQHQTTADNLRQVLREQLIAPWAAVREIGVSLVSSVAIPDLVVLDSSEVEPTSTEQVPEIVRLVVEVASPTTRLKDRTIKAEKYAEAGIPGYWRVDLDPITVIAYALRDGAYAELGTWTAGEIVTVDQPVQVRFDPGALVP